MVGPLGTKVLPGHAIYPANIVEGGDRMEPDNCALLHLSEATLLHKREAQNGSITRDFFHFNAKR